MIVLFFSISLGQVQRVIRLYNRNVLQKNRSIIDERFITAKILAFEIAKDTEFMTFFDVGPELSGKDRYAAYQLSIKLNDYILTYPFVSKAFFFFKSSNSLITNEYRYSSELFYKSADNSRFTRLANMGRSTL